MVDMQAILDGINNDPEEKKKFQADPIGYFESKGLSVPESTKKQLIDNVKAHGGANMAWNVGIMNGPKA